MYDFDEITPALDELWRVIGDHLRMGGVPDVPVSLERVMAYNETWSDPTLLLGQSCGLPIVDQLDGLVRVVGAFAVESASGGGVGDFGAATYSSALVVHRDAAIGGLGGLPWSRGVSVAINGWDSLSGFVSFGAACAIAIDAGALDCEAAFGSVLVTGAHVRSLAAVGDGSADLACIDGHTLALLTRHRPEAVEHVRVIQRGPTIPCVPLITNLSTTPEEVALLREALSAAASDPDLGSARSALGITGFVALDNDAYEPVRAFHDTAKRFFARGLSF